MSNSDPKTDAADSDNGFFINAGTHTHPTLAGDTLYAASEVLDKWELPGLSDVGALRLRLIGLKNMPATGLAGLAPGVVGKHHPNVVLDLDYTVLMPRKDVLRNDIQRKNVQRKSLA